jgi:hypothetical protein
MPMTGLRWGGQNLFSALMSGSGYNSKMSEIGARRGQRSAAQNFGSIVVGSARSSWPCQRDACRLIEVVTDDPSDFLDGHPGSFTEYLNPPMATVTAGGSLLRN